MAVTLISLRCNVAEDLVTEIFEVTQSALSNIKDRIQLVLDGASTFGDVLVDRDGALLTASTPTAGRHHNIKAPELCGWKDVLADAQWLADAGRRA